MTTLAAAASTGSALEDGAPPAPTPTPGPSDGAEAMSPEAEEFYVQPLKGLKSTTGSALELGTALNLIKAGGDAPVTGIAPVEKSKTSASLNSQGKRRKEKSTLSQQSTTSVDSKGNRKKKKKKKEKTILGEDGKPLPKKERTSSSLKSSEAAAGGSPGAGPAAAPDAEVADDAAASTKGKVLAKKRYKKQRAARPKSKMKRMVMVGGVPYYREVTDLNQLTQLDQIEAQPHLLDLGIMAKNGFIPKKDFDTQPAQLSELSKPLEYMPYEAPSPKLKYIHTRDYEMPPGKGGMLPKDRKYITKHPKGWNSQTINPEAWKPAEEVVFRNDGRYHEFRPTDRFIKPKDWRMLNPDAYDPSSKGMFVLQALEDLRTTGGTAAAQQLLLTKSEKKKLKKTQKMLKTTQKMPPRAGKEPASAKAGSTAAEGDAPLVGESAFLTQDGDETSAEATAPKVYSGLKPFNDDAAAAAATADSGEVAEEIVAEENPPDLLSTLPLEQALVAAGQTWTPHKKVGDREFAHGTWGKWDKFGSHSSHRPRQSVAVPQILKRKPKFNAYKYVTKQQHDAVNTAVERAQLNAKGIFEIQRPIKERQLHAEEDRHRASKIKVKPRWNTRTVLVMLKDILSTEDSKLRALETQLHRASEDLARSGAQVYTLDSYRQSIQKIRRRIADLREAVAYVKKDTWLKDITRLLISSAVPLDKFLCDAEGLKADGKYLIDDMPWNNM